MMKNFPFDSCIIVDKAQQAGKHERKHAAIQERGYDLVLAPLPVGDYVLANDKVKDVLMRKDARGTAVKKMDFIGSYDVSVDTKKDMQELYNNIVGKQHPRFRDECILAQNNGIRLVILIENEDGITDVQSVAKWKNPRYTYWVRINAMHQKGQALNRHIPAKPPANSVTLMKALLSMQLKYGVEFQFCKPSETGSRIVDILTEGSEDN